MFDFECLHFYCIILILQIVVVFRGKLLNAGNPLQSATHCIVSLFALCGL